MISLTQTGKTENNLGSPAAPEVQSLRLSFRRIYPFQTTEGKGRWLGTDKTRTRPVAANRQKNRYYKKQEENKWNCIGDGPETEKNTCFLKPWKKI